MVPLLNQIQACLVRPNVWRLVGFSSAVVGLLCYALSSSFNSLFGKWKLWKTFLYCVFSSIICTAVLFAKVWNHSSSLRFKAHMAFLALTITSFYSSFFDKHVSGKPDVYNLVSCAAFAVMSLGLSRQTHCGFEVDLLYFFLGSLIVQLAKIQWLLGIVGMGFSYSLIILRSSLDSHPQANGYSVPQVDIQVGSLPVLASIQALKKKNPTLVKLVDSYKYRDVGKSNPRDHNLFIDTLPSEIITNLNEAMKLAVAAGFEEECCHLYSSCRKELLRQCFSTLNLQDFFCTECDDVDTTIERIQSWRKASHFAVRVMFPNELRLCDGVFFGLSSVGNLPEPFMQICKELTMNLLIFPKNFKVDIGEPLIFTELVEIVLNTLNEIIPELESLFPGQDAMSLRNEAITTRKRLCETVWNIFKDMENLIRYDTRVADVPGGIYPITCDIMDFVHDVFKVRDVIERVWIEYLIVSDVRGTSPTLFLASMTLIIEQLESHWEARSKNFREPALFYVSMMNNIMYIKLKDVDFRIWDRLLQSYPFSENDRIQKLTSKVQQKQNLEDYLRSSWNEVLGLLKLDNEKESAESMREKLELFNIQFEQICSIQSEWFASGELRSEIMEVLENLLLPAYGNFIGRFQDILGSRACKYIKFGMFDIKSQLKLMFLYGARAISEAKS